MTSTFDIMLLYNLDVDRDLKLKYTAWKWRHTEYYLCDLGRFRM